MEQMIKRINVFGDRESLIKLLKDVGCKVCDGMLAFGYISLGDGLWMAKILGTFCGFIEKQIMPKGENFGIVKDSKTLWGMCQASVVLTTLMTPKHIKESHSSEDMTLLLSLASQELENALFPDGKSEVDNNA